HRRHRVGPHSDAVSRERRTGLVLDDQAHRRVDRETLGRRPAVCGRLTTVRRQTERSRTLSSGRLWLSGGGDPTFAAMRVRLNQQRLLAFRAQSRLSQNHWALKLGLSRGHWSEIVNGKHPYPSPKTRERMIEVLGLPFEELFEVETGIPAWADVDFRRAIADRYLID